MRRRYSIRQSLKQAILDQARFMPGFDKSGEIARDYAEAGRGPQLPRQTMETLYPILRDVKGEIEWER